MATWAAVFESLDDEAKEEAAAAEAFLREQKVQSPKKGKSIEKSDFPSAVFGRLDVGVKSAVSRVLAKVKIVAEASRGQNKVLTGGAPVATPQVQPHIVFRYFRCQWVAQYFRL